VAEAVEGAFDTWLDERARTDELPIEAEMCEAAFRAGWQAREPEVVDLCAARDAADARGDHYEQRRNEVLGKLRSIAADRDRALAEVGRLERLLVEAAGPIEVLYCLEMDDSRWMCADLKESIAEVVPKIRARVTESAALQPRGEGEA
jgi:hypothetical protein